jgi:hypothetical protein
MHTHIVVKQKDISMCHAVHHIVLTFSCNSVETTNKMQPCNNLLFHRSKHVEPLMNGGIINSVIRLHLVGCFY